jgi:hypothetical protein
MQITRQQLYEHVWSKPIRQLAKEYGLSDVGLSKLCRRHNIPLPPMGYWMKVSHDIYPPRPPLPPAPPETPESIEIKPTPQRAEKREKYPDLMKECDAIRRDGLQVELPKSMNDLHPLLKHAHQLLKKSRPDSDGRIHPWRGCANILVSPQTLDRAIRITHALFRLLESQGFIVSVREEERNGTYVRILGEELRISMKEKVKRTERVQTSEFDHKYEFHPIGTLFFETGLYYGEGLQHRWEDNPSSQLEDKLVDINDGLIQIALRQRIKQLEWDEIERSEEKERKLREATEQQRKDEQTRFKRLVQDASDWHTSNTIRSYINAVRASMKFDETPEAKAELEQWLEWAKGKADELDPLVNQVASRQNDGDL